MNLNLTVIAGDRAAETKFIQDLKTALQGEPRAVVAPLLPGQDPGHVVFVDGTGSIDTASVLRSLDRAGRAVFLITHDAGAIPASLAQDLVDDVLVHPFRPLEVLSKLRHYEQILMWDEVGRINASFSELIAGLQNDLQLAERLQKSKLPLRFPEVKGFDVKSRYLAGMRSGGDHADLAEAKDGSQLSIVLTDSSNYGLSSAVLSTLVSVMMKLTAEQSRSSLGTVRLIHDALVATLGEKDRLSMFYGVLSRKDYVLKYVNVGGSAAFHCGKDGKFVALPSQGGPITRVSGLPATEAELALQPNDRFALISDGFVEAAGGAAQVCQLLDRFRTKPSVDSINELVYAVKSKFKEPDDMPGQDCTAVIFDVDAKILRLAR
jgi:hypothetical protein